MKRTIIIFWFLLICVFKSNATQQQPDILLIENDTMYIDVGWGHPSPLETYFEQKKIKYPFEMLHTANYRGHVATWEIKNDKFYIKSIQVESKRYNPKEFIESKETNEGILVQWFTGFILARKYIDNSGYDIEYEEYYYLKKGGIVKSAKFSDSDYERIKKEHELGKSLDEIKGIDILMDYEKYVAYYFRQDDDEVILYNNQKGYVTRPKGGKLVMEYYKDIHLDWPFNWEAKGKTGVPIGKWKVINKQVYLTELRIHTGLDFYETEIHEIDLKEIFGNEKSNIKATWLNGIYLIQHRKQLGETDDLLFNDYEIESIRIIELKEGEVVNECQLDGTFNFDEMNEATPHKTKDLVNKYKILIE